nr:transposon TX1 [Tanacetum cinerariifolium]
MKDNEEKKENQGLTKEKKTVVEDQKTIEVNEEVNLLGRLEVMLIFETVVKAYNILNDGDHMIRRWVHNLRKWKKNYKPSGIRTWVNVIGVPVSYWLELVFKRISAPNGTIMGLKNCRLEGNQNIVIRKVHIHAIATCSINETLNIRCNSKVFKVSIVEEVKDITEFAIEENNKKDEHEEQGDNISVRMKEVDESSNSDEDGNEGAEDFDNENVSMVNNRKVLDSRTARVDG